jgi:signal transduction histidine kinase
MSRIFKYLAPLYWFVCVATIAGILYVLINLLLNRLFPYDVPAINALERAFGGLLGMLCCFGSLFFPLHAPDSALTTRAIQRRGPLLLGLVFFTGFMAHILMYLKIIHYIQINESWAKLFFISEYPFLLGVILSLPTRPLSRIASLRIVLASVLIVTAVLTFSWYFFLGPIILYGPQPVLGKAIVATSLFEDLVILFSFLILASRTSDANVQPAKYVLLLGIALLLIGDGLGGYSVVQTGSTGGNPQETLWGISSTLFIISAYYMRFPQSLPAESRQNSSEDRSLDLPPLWYTLLPSALVPAVIVLVTYVWLVGHNDTLAQGVYLGGAMLLGQVVLRQVFSLRETHFYTRKLRLMQGELQAKNHSLGEANLQLEMQAKEIERAYEQQRHLNELKDQFLLNVSHELRTPLTVLGGSLELLEEHHERLDLAGRTHLLREARMGQEELVDLVNRMLDATVIVSEIPQAKLQGVCVYSLLQEVLEHLAPLQDYTIYQQVPEQIVVLADPQFLRQVLRNLLSNISKYVPTQTEVRIEATQMAPTLPVCLSVQDAGPGIPAEELPLLFEKFVRLQRDLAGSMRGTGLGLYICKQLVEAMGGRIWVESSGRQGEGSRFCVVLPPFSLP